MRQQWFTHVRLLIAHPPRYSETSTAALTTPALDRRSLRWFGISACTATPEDLPPSLAQHGSCRRSSTSSSSLPFRTHVGAGNSAVVVDLARCGPMLSPRVPNLRFLVPGWSAKPLVSAHDRIMGTHRRRAQLLSHRRIASHCEPQSRWASKTIRTARSRISSGYVPRCRSVRAPSSQGPEPAQYPVRLKCGVCWAACVRPGETSHMARCCHRHQYPQVSNRAATKSPASPAGAL